MYIPRSLFSSAYAHLKENANPSTTSVLILCALDTDSLCAARILASLLKRDYILHQIKPVAGYQDLKKVNEKLVKGNDELKFIVCLGMGGLVDLSVFLELSRGGGEGGLECWVIDGRRPWNLYNVYAGGKEGDEDVAARGGKVTGGRHGVGESVGGIKCFDDGDIAEEMQREQVAFNALIEMPDVDDDSDSDDDDDDDEAVASDDEEGQGGVNLGLQSSQNSARKRKSSDDLMDDSEDEDGAARSRRPRLNSDAGSSGTSTPILHRHTLLSHATSRPMGSSPPPLSSGTVPITTSPSQHLPSEPQLPLSGASAVTLRRKLRRLRRKHEVVITGYYSQGTWYGEPVSSLLYSLAADLGREDNDTLWLSIVGVCAGETYGRTINSGPPRIAGGGWGADTREDQIRGILKDEVRRLNPPDLNGSASSSGHANGISADTALQTTARSPSDTSIRISPEYRFMLIRHWSLYDSMLHSSYLGTKLHIWSESGRKRLHKLLAKMGFSLSQCKQSYTHMDMDLKRTLKEKLERYAPLYGLDGVVKEGFVRCWGWRGCLSAVDVAYVVGGILEVGKGKKAGQKSGLVDPNDEVSEKASRLEEEKEVEEWITNFWDAYDSLTNIEQLKSALPIAMNLHRAILRTGTALIEKRQIRLLKAFRLAVVKEGPDLPVFTHPNALSKLALWISEAILEQEREASKKKHLPLVVASLNERRGIYVIVGIALGAHVANTLKIKKKKEKKAAKEEKRRKLEEEGLDGEEEDEEDDSDDDSDDGDEMERKGGRNRFGIAFQDVAASTQARIRIDSFEATVVEVKRDDLAGFLESLSLNLNLQ